MTTAVDPCTEFNPKTVRLLAGAHGTVFRGETCLVEAACAATMCCTTLAEKYGKPSQFGDDHPREPSPPLREMPCRGRVRTTRR